MSTGLECEFVCLAAKPVPEWFYILERWDSPKGAWDWHEYAEGYGPFPTLEAAEEHLRRHHANPGGAMVDTEPRDSVTGPLAERIADARKRGTRRGWY